MRAFSMSSTILLMAFTLTYSFAACARGQKFVEHAARLRSKTVLDDQIRTPHPRARHRLLLAPALHVGMIARQQNRRHVDTLEDFRARVLRPLEQPLGEGLLDARALITERTRQQ